MNLIKKNMFVKRYKSLAVCRPAGGQKIMEKYMRKKIFVIVRIGLFVALIAGGVASADNQNKVIAEAVNTKILDIETAGRIALQNNPSIQAVKERITQAEAAVKQARSVFFPSLDAAGTVSKTDYAKTSGLTDVDEQYSIEFSGSG